MDTKAWPEKVDELIQNKKFEELTEQEKELVSKYLQEDEYSAHQMIVQESKLLFADLPVVPNRKDELMAAFDKKHSLAPISDGLPS